MLVSLLYRYWDGEAESHGPVVEVVLHDLYRTAEPDADVTKLLAVGAAGEVFSLCTVAGDDAQLALECSSNIA